MSRKDYGFYFYSKFPKKNQNLLPLTLHGRKIQALKNCWFRLPIKYGKEAVYKI